jgi:hypothetical protein
MKTLKMNTKICLKDQCPVLRKKYHTLIKSSSYSLEDYLLKQSKAKQIKSDIKHSGVDFKKKRTKGINNLYQQKYKHCFNENFFRQLIKEIKAEVRRESKQSNIAIKWKKPMIAWAVDDTEDVRSVDGKRLFIHNIKDLASQYILTPLGGRFTKGIDVAKNLESLFIQHGAPLVFKRDNGSNLNCKEVNNVLEKYHVIDLNSPPYYSKYNGSIENANNLIKKQRKLQNLNSLTEPMHDLSAKLAAQELNHKKRRSLKGKNPCTVFFHEREAFYPFNKSQRKEIYNDLIQTTVETMQQLNCSNKRVWKTAWRKTVEAFLLKQCYINVIENKECKPI